MYSRQEITKQKQAFWTVFGRYMKPVVSAEGGEANWINYKTGIRGIHFKMDADAKRALISIVLSQGDPGLRSLHYEKFLQLRNIFQETLGEDDWVWSPESPDEYGKTIGTISKHLNGVNIFRNEDWPAIISFLKPRLIALDAFWSMVKYGFDD